MANAHGKAKFQGHLAIKVIRANPTLWQRIADQFAAMMRRLTRWS
jgi:hypothetical protein